MRDWRSHGSGAGAPVKFGPGEALESIGEVGDGGRIWEDAKRPRLRGGNGNAVAESSGGSTAYFGDPTEQRCRGQRLYFFSGARRIGLASRNAGDINLCGSSGGRILLGINLYGIDFEGNSGGSGSASLHNDDFGRIVRGGAGF
ncbi:hypothetical protein J5N97_009797 [Dioscorea zingiberensis]|uniref:Uncharacterized protein n=1 Tax=Dioscorea zingiberensis TaxID=325984 RepID=A0A9D5HN14_9LILI|nr:hypothetical protein J5N97_009797 [Dioscorea zingiberensis]